jgi:class 3 adenylate cyclase
LPGRILPAFVVHDPVQKRDVLFGASVNLAARMEPCTPVCSVFVTEDFGALLTANPGNRVHCEYAGNYRLPKGFGTFRMYHLIS